MGIGFGVDETLKVEDAGKGYIWLAAEMSNRQEGHQNRLPENERLLCKSKHAVRLKGGIGYGVDETLKVEDDGKGYIWLAAEMSPGGLALETFRSTPYGK